MKKVILLVLLGLVYFEGKSQLTDAQLITQADTIKNETRAGANTAVRVGRMFENIIYNKINNSKLIDSTKIPYLAKNNNFTGNNTFPNINVSNNNDASGLSINGDITTIGDINNNDAGTTLSIDGHYNTLTINGFLGFTSGQLISSISTDTAMTSNSNAILPTQKAVKSYVTNHQGGGGGSIDTTRIPYLAKNNVFTGDNNFSSIEALSLQASSFINLGGYGVNAFSNDTSLSSSPLYSLPTQNAVKSYVTNHAPNLSGYQVTSNLSNDGTMAANSSTLYPTQQATRTYAAGLVVGLLNDRGSYDASGNVFPSTGGSGTAGAIQKGDLWYIKVAGTLGGTSVVVGSSVRALTNSPGQTSTNWDILNVGLGYVPENIANKSTNVASDSSSTTKYPTVQSVGRYAQALSNLSNNATSDSASTTKYPSVQAITRFVKANSVSYTDTVITLSGTITTTSKYTFVNPTNSGYSLFTNPNPKIGETDYIYNITGSYSLNNNFNLRSNTGTYFYATASSGSYTNNITVDSGIQVRLQYVGSGEWLYSVQNQGLIPQDVNNLAVSINPSDSASNILYPSVNAVKNYVQANIPSKGYYEFRARLYQSGTTAPTIQKVFVDDIDTFSVNSVHFDYISTGTYTCTISTKTNIHFQYCGNNTDISFSDNKITNGTFSTTQSGIIYKNIFTFYTYNSSGVLTDGLLTFSNIYLRVYQ